MTLGVVREPVLAFQPMHCVVLVKPVQFGDADSICQQVRCVCKVWIYIIVLRVGRDWITVIVCTRIWRGCGGAVAPQVVI